MVAGFWVWWPAFGWLSCYGFAGFVVGTWWVLFCFFIFIFLFWVFGSGFRRLGRIWVAFGWCLGWRWVVGFKSGGCDFFRWVGGFVPMGLMVGFGVCWVCLGRG